MVWIQKSDFRDFNRIRGWIGLNPNNPHENPPMFLINHNPPKNTPMFLMTLHPLHFLIHSPSQSMPLTSKSTYCLWKVHVENAFNACQYIWIHFGGSIMKGSFISSYEKPCTILGKQIKCSKCQLFA